MLIALGTIQLLSKEAMMQQSGIQDPFYMLLKMLLWVLNQHSRLVFPPTSRPNWYLNHLFLPRTV